MGVLTGVPTGVWMVVWTGRADGLNTRVCFGYLINQNKWVGSGEEID